MTPAAGRPMPTVRFGARRLPVDRAAVMAIITRPSDAGSDRSCTRPDQLAMAAVDCAVHEGADIVNIADIAGNGTAEDSPAMVLLVAAVRQRHPELVISVRTRAREVACAALDAGADIVDWVGVDLALAEVAAERGCGVVCHDTRYARCAPSRTPPYRVSTTDVVRDVIDDLTAQATTLVGLGVPKEAILVDPTHDASPDTRLGLELLRRSNDLVAAGWPVLMTLSSREVSGKDVAKAPDAGVNDRLGDIMAATAIAAWAGIRVLRVHQVRQTRRVLDMVASIAGIRPPVRAIRGLARRGPA